MAEPPAPAISRAVPIGAACWTTASTAAEPVKDCAPNCLIRPPTCSAITAPKGMATSAVGMMVTEAMNEACWMNSRRRKGGRKSDRPTSRLNAKSFPVAPIGAETRLAMEVMCVLDLGGHRHVAAERPGWRRHAVLPAPGARLPLAAAADPAGGLQLQR